MNIEVANRLQQLRKAKGLSQEELANILGLSRQAISKWERAETSPDTDNLICLAKLYNISIDKLLDTGESIEEIKERIAQERIDEIDNGINNASEQVEKEDTTESINNEENSTDKEIISERDIEFDETQEKVREKKERIVSSMFGISFIIGIALWIIIGQLNKDSWKWGWVFSFVMFGFIFSFQQTFVNKKFDLSGIGTGVFFLGIGLLICDSDKYYFNGTFLFIAVGLLLIQLIINMVVYYVFFAKNRKTVDEVFYKEQLIEIKHEYEKKIEKLKNRLH